MRFNIGEKVTFLSESGYGVVLSYKTPFIVVVEDETGFDREFPESELVKILGNQEDVVNLAEENGYEIPGNIGQTAPRGVTKMKDFWEIDLHSHTLLDTERGLSSSQILERQLYEFKRCFREVRVNKIHKFVIIHGIGEGVLKSEVRKFLEGQEDIEFFDGSYVEYGKGATEVRLYYRY